MNISFSTRLDQYLYILLNIFRVAMLTGRKHSSGFKNSRLYISDYTESTSNEMNCSQIASFH